MFSPSSSAGASRLRISAARAAVTDALKDRTAAAGSCEAVPWRHRWPHGARRSGSVVLALVILAATFAAPVVSLGTSDACFGAADSAARGDDHRGGLRGEDPACAVRRPTWAAHSGGGSAMESLRAARKTAPATPLRFATLGAAPPRGPTAREIARLGTSEHGRVHDLTHSLGSAPRGPPTA